VTAVDPRAGSLQIAEIFASIQGESTWAGMPCVFVRLAGCGVGCAYCDTAYAQSGGEAMSIEAIRKQCAVWPSRLVEITGGEPLEQDATPALAQAFLDAGYTVLCETSGTLPIGVLPKAVVKIMDLKCPGSGVCDKNDWSNIDALSPRDEVKFVIGDRRDYEWSCDTLRAYTLDKRCHAVLFAPVFGILDLRVLAEWLVAEDVPARLQVQMHKYIWPGVQRGV